MIYVEYMLHFAFWTSLLGMIITAGLLAIFFVVTITRVWFIPGRNDRTQDQIDSIASGFATALSISLVSFGIIVSIKMCLGI